MRRCGYDRLAVPDPADPVTPDDEALDAYVLRWYAHRLTPFEVRVQRAALAIAKGQPPAARRWAGGDDPDVREALADGWPRARAAIAARILREHATEVTFNPCPRCAHRRRSPQARLCLACGHDERT